MSGKILLLIAIFLIPVLISGELIKTSAINEVTKGDRKVSRNIFSPRKTISSVKMIKSNAALQKKRLEQKKREETTEDRVIATVFYEGFLLKENKKFALLKVNGQYYISGEGDKIPGSIILKKIYEKKILLEIESSEVIIAKKGERNVN